MFGAAARRSGVWRLFAAVVLAAGPGVAQEPGGAVIDAAFGYTARHSVVNPQTGGEDNDFVRGVLGVSWGPDAAWRFAVEAGATVDEAEDRRRPAAGAELQRVWQTPAGRHLVGVRARWADDLTTTGELAYGFGRFGLWRDALDLRALAGIQALADEDRVTARDEVAAFALGEVTVYPTRDIALRLGLAGDDQGDLVLLGYEQKFGRLPVSLTIDWGVTATGYRDFDSYNDLAVGIRFLPRGRSVKADARRGTARAMHRYVEVQ